MHMGETEIVISYKYAKNKAHQINILADLNACSPIKIKNILAKNGLDTPQKKVNKWTPEEEDKLKQMAADGCRPYKIAKELGRSYYSVLTKLQK